MSTFNILSLHRKILFNRIGENQIYWFFFTRNVILLLNIIFQLIFFLFISVGVTVLLEPPLVDDINNTIPGAKEFPHSVTPSDAKESTDPTSIGFTFTVSEDKSVTRYGNVYIRSRIVFTVSCVDFREISEVLFWLMSLFFYFSFF